MCCCGTYAYAESYDNTRAFAYVKLLVSLMRLMLSSEFVAVLQSYTIKVECIVGMFPGGPGGG